MEFGTYPDSTTSKLNFEIHTYFDRNIFDEGAGNLFCNNYCPDFISHTTTNRRYKYDLYQS